MDWLSRKWKTFTVDNLNEHGNKVVMQAMLEMREEIDSLLKENSKLLCSNSREVVNRQGKIKTAFWERLKL